MKAAAGQLRQGQAAGAAGEPGGVLVGPEGPDRAVGVPVGLHALEDLLRVVQDRGRRLERDGPVCRDAGVVPAPVGGPRGQHHVVGEGLAEAGVGEDRLALLVWQRVRAPLHGELEGGLGQCRGLGHQCLQYSRRIHLQATAAPVTPAGVFASATALAITPTAGEPEAGRAGAAA